MAIIINATGSDSANNIIETIGDRYHEQSYDCHHCYDRMHGCIWCKPHAHQPKDPAAGVDQQ